MAELAEEKNITTYRKARHEYTIVQTYEAGISLVGTEVKALRQNKANLTDSYAIVKEGQVWLINANIGSYDFGNINNHDPFRARRLLLNRNEIRKLNRAVVEKSCTLIPLRLYFKKGLVKVELAIATGKKQYDKREDIAKRDYLRDQERKYKN